jgi:hypothetical protein
MRQVARQAGTLALRKTPVHVQLRKCVLTYLLCSGMRQAAEYCVNMFEIDVRNLYECACSSWSQGRENVPELLSSSSLCCQICEGDVWVVRAEPNNLRSSVSGCPQHRDVDSVAVVHGSLQVTLQTYI